MEHFIGKYLDVFIAASEELNFSKVANRHGLTRAQISKQIAQLEKELGVSLFHRSTRSMHLTAAGQQLYQTVQPYYQQVKGCIATLRNETEKIEGLIRVNSPFSFGLSKMISCVSAFNKVQPNIKINLILGSFYGQALAGSFDISIIVKDSMLPKNPHTKILSRSSMLCASPSYIKKTTKIKSPRDLLSHQCLVYANPGEQRNNWFFTKKGQQFKVKVSGPLQVNSSNALLQAASHGMGVAKLPSFILDSYLKSKKLVRVLADYNLKENNIYAVFSRVENVPIRCQLFVSFMQSFFKKDD
jgi:DNA-binding transcriptional LysR family regulator